MNKVCFRLLAVLAAAFSTLLSCKQDPAVEPEPEPAGEYESLRAYQEESEDVSISLPETTVYIKGDVAEDLQSVDPQWGSITFRNSEALKYQKIKEGDILYSARRTAIAPKGYCLRVLGVSESGGTVTYRTEPASILEAVDHLKEKDVFSFGNYKPEDINVYFTEVDAEQTPQTRGEDDDPRFDLELKGDKYEFKSDGKSTSFKIDVWEDKDHGEYTEGKLKLTLGIKVQHEILNDMDSESYFSADEGNFVLFCMAKIGVGVTVEFGSKYKPYDAPIDPKSPDYEYRKTINDLAKASLIGKRFKLLDLPLVPSPTNIVCEPRFVVYGEFKLDLNGKLVIEAGVKDAIYAINIANDGYSLKWKEGWSYVRKVKDFHPYFDITATASLKASAGLGFGLNLEMPFWPIKYDDHMEPSAIGIFFGFEVSESVDISLKGNLIAGETEITAEGKDGKVTCEVDVTGAVGIGKAKLDINWRAIPKEGEDLELVTIPGWKKTWAISSPAPYDLQSEVNGDTALLSWKQPDNLGFGADTRIYVEYSVAGDVGNAYTTHFTGTELLYGPAKDGHYRWKVENRTLDEGLYSSSTESFEISNSKITTGTPVLKGDTWEIPVTLNTLNEVKSKGVVYSSLYSEPSPDTEDCAVYEGDDSSFTVSINNLLSGLTYHARSYAYIQKNGGWFVIYGDVVTLSVEPPKMTLEPSSLDFGNVVMGETAVLPISFTNVGGLDLVVSSITCADGFSTPLAEGEQYVVKPGETRELNVSFSPTENRPYGGTMIINSNASGSQTAVVKLSGNGVTPAVPQIVVDPYSIVFDPVVEGSGQYSETPLAITNIGDAVLTISSIELTDAGTPFEIIGNKPQTLDKDARTQITIRFSPTEAGSYMNTLVIKSDASNSTELSIPVSGECTPAPLPGISVSPQSVEFGEVNLGDTVTRDLIITNTGSAPLDILSVTCPDGFDSDFNDLAEKSVAGGSSVSLAVTFRPFEAKGYGGSIEIASNDAENAVISVPVSGNGVNTSNAEISSSSTYIRFDEREVGAVSTRTVAISNRGTDPLKIFSVSCTDGFSTDFESWSASSISPGGSHDMVITFSRPEAKYFGGSIVIYSNAKNASAFSISVSGRCDEITIPEAVDIGLSVKWADRNIGAADEGRGGLFYAWGETETKHSYSWGTYKWYRAAGSDLDCITKYNPVRGESTYDGKGVLDPEDDVARVKLGGRWRMPTLEEARELQATRTNSKYKWEWVDGDGWRITYIPNGNSIFLPRSGDRIGAPTMTYSVDDYSYGHFWTTSVSADWPVQAWLVQFGEFGMSVTEGGVWYNRSFGLPIRPVCD